MVSMECIFCSLLFDSPSTKWIARNKHAAALLPLAASSLAPGHTLVIPTVHFAEVQEADLVSLNATMDMIQKVATAMKDGLGATGVNLLSASGAGSEQSVPHMHFHVVPRWVDDGFTTWPQERSSRTISADPFRLLAEAMAKPSD